MDRVGKEGAVEVSWGTLVAKLPEKEGAPLLKKRENITNNTPYDSKKLHKHRDDTVIPVRCLCGYGGVNWLMCGAAVISSSTLSVFNLCCDGALLFPQFCPAVLKPNLAHKNMQYWRECEDGCEKMEGDRERKWSKTKPKTEG